MIPTPPQSIYTHYSDSELANLAGNCHLIPVEDYPDVLREMAYRMESMAQLIEELEEGDE